MPDLEITTPRFTLRPLNEADATERYLSWMREDAARRFIAGALDGLRVTDLRDYIAERMNRADVLFLGIFTKADGTHIGNIKYEPVDDEQGYAVMGILIGDPDWRGRSVASEVLDASAVWLQQNRGIREIVLGVDRDNVAAIRSYEKAHFTVAPTQRIAVDPTRHATMVRCLSPGVAG